MFLGAWNWLGGQSGLMLCGLQKPLKVEKPVWEIVQGKFHGSEENKRKNLLFKELLKLHIEGVEAQRTAFGNEKEEKTKKTKLDCSS